MKDNEYFDDKLIESAEIVVDVVETYKQKVNKLAKIFKSSVGRPMKDFKAILDYKFFVAGIPEDTSKGKLEMIIEKFIVAAKYFEYLGLKEEKIDRILANFGMELTITEPFVPSAPNIAKLKENWGVLYDDEIPARQLDLVEFLLSEGMNAKMSILELENDVQAISENIEIKCEVSKSAFKKGVSLKAKTMLGKDISENVSKINQSANELSEVLDKL